MKILIDIPDGTPDTELDRLDEDGMSFIDNIKYVKANCIDTDGVLHNDMSITLVKGEKLK